MITRTDPTYYSALTQPWAEPSVYFLSFNPSNSPLCGRCDFCLRFADEKTEAQLKEVLSLAQDHTVCLTSQHAHLNLGDSDQKMGREI